MTYRSQGYLQYNLESYEKASSPTLKRHTNCVTYDSRGKFGPHKQPCSPLLSTQVPRKACGNLKHGGSEKALSHALLQRYDERFSPRRLIYQITFIRFAVRRKSRFVQDVQTATCLVYTCLREGPVGRQIDPPTRTRSLVGAKTLSWYENVKRLLVQRLYRGKTISIPFHMSTQSHSRI
jgi:hypothetical protein